MLLLQPLLFVGGQFANLDMLVAGCITATVLALAHAALRFEQGQPHRRALWLGYALAGLGVLAKGLIGFVIPALTLGLWVLLRWRWRTLWALLSLPGVAIFLLVAAPWYVAMQMRFDDFLHYFFVVQHFQRFSVGGFNNVMPVWFYPAVLALLSLPSLVWCPHLLDRGYWAGAFGPRATQQGAVRLLMLVAVGSVLLFFSIPKSKLVGYVLPAVAPLAWLLADASQRLATTPGRRRAWAGSVASGGLLALAVVGWLTLHQDYSLRGLGQTLRAQHQADEPVYMLEEYFYDVPFYAHLRAPVHVVDDWGTPAVKQRDNWRKEIADAGEFDTAAAQRLLLRPEALLPALCAAPVSWVMAEQYLAPRYPFLAQAEAVRTVHEIMLWRVRAAQLTACAETPSGGSAGK